MVSTSPTASSLEGAALDSVLDPLTWLDKSWLPDWLMAASRT